MFVRLKDSDKSIININLIMGLDQSGLILNIYSGSGDKFILNYKDNSTLVKDINLIIREANKR